MWDRITKSLEKEIGWYFKPKNVEIGPLVKCLKELLEAPIDEKYNLGGLSSNIPYAIEKVLDDKSDKNERIANFSILKNIEPFLKKILFFVANDKFNDVLAEKKMLIDIINYLNLNPENIYFRESVLSDYDRDDYNHHLTRCYLVRNAESHDAKEWNQRELAFNIESLLIFYLEVVRKYQNQLEDKLLQASFDVSEHINSEIERFEKQAKRFVATESTEDFNVFESYAVENSFSSDEDFDDDEDSDDEDDDEEEVKERSGTVDDIRKNKLPEKRMILWGDAGLGKSTTLQYLTYIDAKDYRDQKSDVVPVYLPLGMLIDKEKTLESYIFGELKISPEKGRELFQAGKINLFLDGVNEIPEEKKSNVLKEIQAILDNYRNSLVIVSNRPEKQNQFTDVPVFRLQMMNYSKIVDFLNKNTKNQEIREIILDKINKNNRLQNLIGTPLMATRLISIVREFKKVPESEGTIIKEFLAYLYVREIREKKDTRFDAEKIDLLLTDLAAYGFNKNKTNSAVSRKEVMSCFAETMNKYRFDYDSSYALDTLIKMGLLSSDKDGEAVVFGHQAYQDYYLSKSGIFPTVAEKAEVETEPAVIETPTAVEEIKPEIPDNETVSEPEEIPQKQEIEEEPVETLIISHPHRDSTDEIREFYQTNAQNAQYEKSIMYRLHNMEDREERNKEIKILAEYNVLLAAKAIASGERDPEIEDYVMSMAAAVFDNFKTAKSADLANAFLVSIELENDEMLKSFLKTLSKRSDLQKEKEKEFKEIDREIDRKIEQLSTNLPLELQKKWTTSAKAQRNKIEGVNEWLCPTKMLTKTLSNFKPLKLVFLKTTATQPNLKNLAEIRKIRKMGIRMQIRKQEGEYSKKILSVVEKISYKCNENQILKIFTVLADDNALSSLKILQKFTTMIPENLSFSWTSENKSLMEKITEHINAKVLKLSTLAMFYVKLNIPKIYVKKEVIDHAKKLWGEPKYKTLLSIYDPDFITQKQNRSKPDNEENVIKNKSAKDVKTTENRIIEQSDTQKKHTIEIDYKTLLLCIKAAIYVTCKTKTFAYKPSKLNDCIRDLHNCSKIITLKHLIKGHKNSDDKKNFSKLHSILQKCIAKKELNSEEYKMFFADANEFFQELKPYADAYYEVKIRNINLEKLSFYLNLNDSNQVSQPSVEKAPKENAEKK